MCLTVKEHMPNLDCFHGRFTFTEGLACVADAIRVPRHALRYHFRSETHQHRSLEIVRQYAQ